MGSKYEVWAYLRLDGGYRYEHVWQGESPIRALIAARRWKRTAGCVKLEWRG